MADAVSSVPTERRIPRSRLRFAATFAHMAAHVALGIAIVGIVFPFTGEARHRQLIRWWSGRILTILRVRLHVIRPQGSASDVASIDRALQPDASSPRGAMLVMNHVSWLDIFIVHSLRPAHFVAKAEIARWPLLGFMVGRTGTIFIERGKRHAVREVNHRVATLLRDGELVGMFPEGATGAGDRLLPFHGNLLQPAIDACTVVVVAGVRYREVDGAPTDATLYTSEINLVQSLLRLARHGPIVAELSLIDALDAAGMSRHTLAHRARELIGAALGFDDEAREIAEELSTVIVVADVNPASAPARTEPGMSLDPRDELL